MHKHGGDIYSHPNLIDFSANINFLGVPETLMEAARDALNEVIHYPQPGSIRLCEAIAQMEGVDATQIICGNGAADVIFSLALAEKPQKALLPAPTFQEYEQALQSVDCKIERIALLAEDFSWESFAGKITEDIDMVFFCNPNNPTGVVYPREGLEKLLQKCAKTGTRLVVDECFLDFVSREDTITMKPYLVQFPNLFIIKAFTKMFAIPGIRLGYGMLSDEKLLLKMQTVTQPWNVSVIAQQVGVVATKETDFIEKTRQAIEIEKEYLLQELGKLPVELYGHAANFICFRGEENLDKKLEQHGILIRNCSNFQGLEEGWYRIAVRNRQDNQLLIQTLKKVFEV